jgi:hypothetical protein
LKKTKTPKIKTEEVKATTQLMPVSLLPTFIGESTASQSEPSRQRRRKDIFTDELTKYQNIREFLLPFSCVGDIINISDAITICQKAYFGVPIIRNIVDIMAEFANADLFLEGGSEKVNIFVDAWLEKINIWDIKEKFFREFFRSANPIFYRQDAKFSDLDITKMGQVFGAKNVGKIPIRYILLNPADIRILNSLAYLNPVFYKLLNNYEIARLKNPTTEEEKDFLKSLPSDTQKDIKNNLNPLIPLAPEKIYFIPYKKQDYEPFGVPFYYGVLEDIEMKLEFKKMDRAIAKTADWAILLLTAGSELGVLPATMQTLQTLFQNEQLKRVLVSDYTTKAQWVIPDIEKILGKTKYEQVNEDILIGLNAALFNTDEKFANQSVKVQIFLERLIEAQEAFIKNFLQPEIKRVCQEMGFKNYPTVEFQEKTFKDDLEYDKLYVRLSELGLLTGEEVVEALDSGKLPSNEESLVSQKAFKEARDKGLYAPLLNSKQQMQEGATPDGGRPKGLKAPQTTKKVKPIGAAFSISKIKDTLLASDKLLHKIQDEHKKKFKLETLSKEQEEACQILVRHIIINEDESKWDKKVNSYMKNPKPLDESNVLEVDEIAAEYGVDDYLASVLFLSKFEEEKV